VLQAATQSHVLPVGAEFLELTEGEVAPEDIAFHKFYTTKVSRKGKIKRETKIKEDIDSNSDENDLVGDESDDEEIEDLLEQEEGEEMGFDDLTDDENDSEGEWIFNEGGAVTEHNMDEEDNTSREDMLLDVTDLSDDDIASAGVDEGSKSRSARGTSKKESRKKRKQKLDSGSKGQQNRSSGSAKKSPFASFEEYSHMLDIDDPDIVPSQKKSKRAKSETHT
jgi:ribosome biogenesis protein MAK21